MAVNEGKILSCLTYIRVKSSRMSPVEPCLQSGVIHVKVHWLLLPLIQDPWRPLSFFTYPRVESRKKLRTDSIHPYIKMPCRKY